MTEIRKEDRGAALRLAGYKPEDEPMWSKYLDGRPGTLVESYAERFAAHRVAAVKAEREACCHILASNQADTAAEKALVAIDAWANAHRDEMPHELDNLLNEWCIATANELADWQRLIRARNDL